MLKRLFHTVLSEVFDFLPVSVPFIGIVLAWGWVVIQSDGHA